MNILKNPFPLNPDRYNIADEVLDIPNAYDKGKTRVHLRHVTISEIPDLRGGYWMIDKNGQARRIRTNSTVKTWKREPLRFECSFSYGMYEHFRLNTKQILDEVFVAV